MKKLLIYFSGDEYSNSVEHFIILKNVDFDLLKKEYDENGGYHGHNRKWFPQVLLERNLIREINDNDPIVFIKSSCFNF